jgi:hypothetical protein
MYWLAAAGVVSAAVIASFRIQVLQQRRLVRIDERLAHLTAGISLLTDTAESGLRDVAREIERISAPAASVKPKARGAAQRRVSSAARRGKSVKDIAAAEGMSEGEVRLRMQLGSQRAGARAGDALSAASREKAHATVR